jgi:hypothetical protein
VRFRESPRRPRRFSLIITLKKRNLLNLRVIPFERSRSGIKTDGRIIFLGQEIRIENSTDKT